MAVTMRINEEHNGIELYFPDSERPSEAVKTALKQEHGFRWHYKGKYWFARQTPERLAFARKLTGEPEKEQPKEAASTKKKAEAKKAPEPKKENTFAASYDKIGSFEIRDGADVGIHDIPAGMYCKDLNALIRHSWGYDDCIIVTDLENAGKSGKTCKNWRIYTEKKNDLVSNHLFQSENIHNCAELLQALREGKWLKSVTVYPSEDKGIEVFTPFQEVKPLKEMPQEWNKRNFTQALLSGQIYMGHVDYHYTDDYALDAAYDFQKGVGINIPVFARDVVEGWHSTYHVYRGTPDEENKTCPVNFSAHSNSSKTVYFDLTCDIAEGKRRADEKAAGIESYNNMMKASCIRVAEEDVDESKVYTVTSLEMNQNTKVYGTRTDLVQGGYLLEQLSEDLGDLEFLSVNEEQIVPDKLYEVASFFHPRTYAEPDDRIIDCGNSLQIVTGKALLELTAEGIHLPHIKEAYGEYRNIHTARETLEKFISGQASFLFTGRSKTDYERALASLNREVERASGPQKQRSGVDALIAAANSKKAASSEHSTILTPDRSR